MEPQDDIPRLVWGAAALSNQLHPDPSTLPTIDLVRYALEHFGAIDTSPYYGPSEALLGAALASLSPTHPRSTYRLLTKAGRLTATTFDYSPAAVTASVARSCARLHATHLDLVFAHDVEFVPRAAAIAAVGALVACPAVRAVGISGYPLSVLVEVARGGGVEAVQVWGQCTLLNTRLVDEGGRWLGELREAGVKVVYASSPLAIGLLRRGGVPVGELGDFHPAPAGLRERAREVAEWVGERGGGMAAVGVRFAVARGLVAGERAGVEVRTVLGGGTVGEMEENWRVAGEVVRRFEERKRERGGFEDEGEEGVGGLLTGEELELVKGAREMFGEWLNYSLGD